MHSRGQMHSRMHATENMPMSDDNQGGRHPSHPPAANLPGCYEAVSDVRPQHV